MAGDGAETHGLERLAQGLRAGSRVLDEFDAVQAQRVARLGLDLAVDRLRHEDYGKAGKASARAAAPGAGGLKDKAKGLLGKLKGGGKPEENEAAAAETLRKLQVAQASFRAQRVVDADGDGKGEAGTWMELAGVAVPRGGFSPASGERAAGSDFSGPGSARGKPALDAAFGAVDGDGTLEREGYLFRIFLPDDRAAEAGFVHETGPADAPGIAGDSLRVGVDLAETVWMAYAWPKERGKTGTAAFFVGAEGNVLRSPNEAARWSGTARAPKPSSALLGAGITSRPAAGTHGRDGDRWE